MNALEAVSKCWLLVAILHRAYITHKQPVPTPQPATDRQLRLVRHRMDAGQQLLTASHLSPHSDLPTPTIFAYFLALSQSFKQMFKIKILFAL